MPNILDLSARLSADVRPFVTSMAGSAQASASSFQYIAQAATMYLGGRGLLSTLNSANQAAMRFGQQMADASAISTLSVEQLKKTALGLDNVFGKASKASESMYRILSSGFSKLGTKELQDFQKAVGISSKIIRADLYSTADVMTTIANAYKLDIKEIEKLQDWFYLTVREGKARGQDLARTLGLVINSASEAGVSLNELGAAIAVLSRTQSVSQSMIGLNQMLNAFIKPTLQAQKAAKKWGIELNATALQTRGLTSFLQELHEKVGGNVEALEAMFGNIRAGRAILSLTGKQFQSYMDVLGTYNTEAGGGAKAFEKQTDTLQTAYEKFQAQQEKTLIQIGDDWEGVRKKIYLTGEALLKAFSDSSAFTRWTFYIAGISLAVKNIIGTVRNLKNTIDRTTMSVDRMTSAFTRASSSVHAMNRGIYAGARPDTLAFRDAIASQLHVLTNVGGKENILTQSLKASMNVGPGGVIRDEAVNPMSFITKNTLVRGIPEHEMELARIARAQIAKEFYPVELIKNKKQEVVDRIMMRHGDTMKYNESALLPVYMNNAFDQRNKWVQESLARVHNAEYGVWSAKANEARSLYNAKNRVSAFYSKPKGLRVGSIRNEASIFAKEIVKATSKTVTNPYGLKSRSDIEPFARELNRFNNHQAGLFEAFQKKKEYDIPNAVEKFNSKYAKYYAYKGREEFRPNEMSAWYNPRTQRYTSLDGRTNYHISTYDRMLQQGLTPKKARRLLKLSEEFERSLSPNEGSPVRPWQAIMTMPKNIPAGQTPLGQRLYNSRLVSDMREFTTDAKNAVYQGFQSIKTFVGNFGPNLDTPLKGTSLERTMNYKSSMWYKKYRGNWLMSKLNPYAKGTFMRNMLMEGNLPAPSGSGMLGNMKHWAAREMFVKPGRMFGAEFMKSIGPAMNALFTVQLAGAVAEWGWNIGKRLGEALELSETGYFRRLGGWLANLTGGGVQHIDVRDTEKEIASTDIEILRMGRTRAAQRAQKAGMEQRKIDEFMYNFAKIFNENDDSDTVREKLRELVNNFNAEVMELDTHEGRLSNIQKERKGLLESHNKRGIDDFYTTATKKTITERLTDFSKFEGDQRALSIARRAVDENLSDAAVRNIIANSRTTMEILADSQDATGKLYYARQEALYGDVMEAYGKLTNLSLVNDIFEGKTKLADIQSFYDTIKENPNTLGYYSDGKFSKTATENSKRMTAKSLKYILALFENNKGDRADIVKQINADFTGPMVSYALNEVLENLNDGLVAAEDDSLKLEDMKLDLTDSKATRKAKAQISRGKADSMIKAYNKSYTEYIKNRDEAIKRVKEEILANAPGITEEDIMKEVEKRLKDNDDTAASNIKDFREKVVNAVQTAQNQEQAVYKDELNDLSDNYKLVIGMLTQQGATETFFEDYNRETLAFVEKLKAVAREYKQPEEDTEAAVKEILDNRLEEMLKAQNNVISNFEAMMEWQDAAGINSIDTSFEKRRQFNLTQYNALRNYRMAHLNELTPNQIATIDHTLYGMASNQLNMEHEKRTSDLQYELNTSLRDIDINSIRRQEAQAITLKKRRKVYKEALGKLQEEQTDYLYSSPDAEFGGVETEYDRLKKVKTDLKQKLKENKTALKDAVKGSFDYDLLMDERYDLLDKLTETDKKMKKEMKRNKKNNPRMDTEKNREYEDRKAGLQRELYSIDNALREARHEARNQLMGTVASVISGNMSNGRLTNFGIHHAMNLLSRLSPGFKFDVGGASLGDVMRNARARYSGSTPDVSKAMTQQRRLSDMMDAYIVSKQYEDAGIGKNVQTIVTIMGKRLPLFLN